MCVMILPFRFYALIRRQILMNRVGKIGFVHWILLSTVAVEQSYTSTRPVFDIHFKKKIYMYSDTKTTSFTKKGKKKKKTHHKSDML